MFFKFRIKPHAHRVHQETMQRLRACLKIGDVPSGEEFGAAGKQFFRRNPDGFQAFLTRSEQEILRQGMCVSHWYSF